MAERVAVDRLGARADGIAHGESGAIYVPYALPGETALIEREGSRARLIAIEEPSPDRVQPFCPYFGACGGCLTQHIAQASYASWKRAIVTGSLERAGIDAPVEPLADAHGEGRRRVTLHARFKDRLCVGYMAPRSHDIVEIAFCPIVEPALKIAPLVARTLAEALASARKPLDIQITATDTGLDIDIRGHGPLSERERQALIEAAARHDLARLSLHRETLVAPRAPIVTVGAARVSPPPGGFLQATRAAEETLGQIVLEGCGKARRIADLFAGCGPFALRLAARSEVHAADGDTASLAALDKAARSTSGLKRVSTEARDLFRRPLLATELERFDAVVLDPPRAGAVAQAKQLAASKVATVVSVSCDVGTFVGDAAALIAGGYRLERVVPVDQFKYSPHLEIVGLFRRATMRR